MEREQDDPYWYGSLAIDQKDATGLSYRRNRYYDPVSGQFTQTDPIGIAGGPNTYGYAGGDPINFSDPFGLCPRCDQWAEEGSHEFRRDVEAGLEALEADRAARNVGLPQSATEAAATPGAELMGPPQDLIHQQGGAPREQKWVIRNHGGAGIGSREVVFDGMDRSVVTGGKAGSYNYVTPLSLGSAVTNPVGFIATSIGHAIADMAPPMALKLLRGRR